MQIISKQYKLLLVYNPFKKKRYTIVGHHSLIFTTLPTLNRLANATNNAELVGDVVENKT